MEADALKKAAELLDEAFEEAVMALVECRGRVIVTGIGKSALIGQKIVATFNSTGTPSVFMHAADAIHGDLGILQPDDVLIALSNSGNTPEIKVLIPIVKRQGVKIIGITAGKGSFLGANSDIVIEMGQVEEASPLVLAPTTSTTLTLALGDALAVCLLELRNFQPEDFARYHPGGSLGKKLYLTVGDLYKFNGFPKVKSTDRLPDVIITISANRLGATLVDPPKGQDGFAIITDGDLRRMLQQGIPYESVTAGDIAIPNPKSIETSALAVRALETMRANNIAQLVVTKLGKPVGFIHLHDILREGLV